MKRTPILHPFLFALYPVAALYAYNIGQVAPEDTLRPALIALAAASVLLLALWVIVKNGHRAGLAASAMVLLFSSYGHVQHALAGRFPGSFVTQNGLLVPVWSAAMLLLGWLFLRHINPLTARSLTQIFNVVSAAALLMAGSTIGAAWARGGLSLEPKTQSARGVPVTGVVDGPDIYYIVVDTYGRQDVLFDLFGADQREFMDFLDAEGFFVAQNSSSNYGQTLLSMASSLNLDYVQQLMPIRPESDNRLPLNRLIAQNQAARFLKRRGYRTVFIASSFIGKHQMETDLYLSPTATGATTFERLLLEGTMAVNFAYEMPAERLRYAYARSLEMLREQAAQPGPKFVVFYTTLLHTPYVLDRDGNPIDALGMMKDSPPEAYFEGYPGHLAYTNRALQEAVTYILAVSERPPVIVIQGDHGTSVNFHFNDLDENSCLVERFSIMNAYYLPGVEDTVYHSITPVNTFRVIFNAYFDAGFGLLPDRSYFSTWVRPYLFHDVTARAEACAALGDRLAPP